MLNFLITAKPQSKADCFTVGLAYGGEDILTAGWHNIQASPEACQTSCQVLLLYIPSFSFSNATGINDKFVATT